MGGPFLTSSASAAPGSDSLRFTCNICGRENERPRDSFGRETPSCDGCGSSVRARALIHMLARELFGADLALPDFPVVKSIRGIGLSDSCHDKLLAEKLDYRNTHYHKEPRFDIVNMDPSHAGAYDFLISSEVFEHVEPPARTAFDNAFRALKPSGVLLLTVPYTLDNATAEHFPELYEYGLAQLGERYVLVNRRRDGQVEVFEDLCFHGGPGSTLEMRRFSERDLRALVAGAGFLSLEIYARNYEPFGIVRTETWSLPMAARKAPFALSAASSGEIFEQWAALKARSADLDKRFKEYHAWATEALAQQEREVRERTEWAQGLESQLAERTAWARSLEQDLASHTAAYQKLQSEHAERTGWALQLKAEIEQLEAKLAELNQQGWIRAGRRLGTLR